MFRETWNILSTNSSIHYLRHVCAVCDTDQIHLSTVCVMCVQCVTQTRDTDQIHLSTVSVMCVLEQNN